MTRVLVPVEAELPEGVTPAEWRGYVQAEVRANVGGLDPREPLFHLDRRKVKAKLYKHKDNAGQPG